MVTLAEIDCSAIDLLIGDPMRPVKHPTGGGFMARLSARGSVTAPQGVSEKSLSIEHLFDPPGACVACLRDLLDRAIGIVKSIERGNAAK
jgi:hypothetical protein